MTLLTSVQAMQRVVRRVVPPPAPAPAPAAASSGPVTSFTLSTTAASGTYPFTMGLSFKKGDIPANLAIGPIGTYQVSVKRTWNDGSVKHAIVSGRAPLVQNVARTFTASPGTPPSGTNLTASSIQAAAPTASVQCGAIGTVSLSSLLASPVRTWVSGPEMVECHYRADVGGGTLLSVWFHVRLFADGRMWVRAIVENGYIDNGAGALASNAIRSYVPTISIGGSSVYTNGGASLTHYANTRYSAEGWIGGDPAITPLVSATYLRRTGLVPNYGFGPAGSTALNALTQTYTPMGQGQHSTDMGSTGFQPGIGILPNWDAMFCASGDARAFKSVLANSSAMNSYPIVWRDKTTNLPPKPSTFTNWTLTGPNGGGDDGYNAGTLRWEVHHHSGAGYLAYLLTGDYWHLETAYLQAAMCYLITSQARGSGVNRFMNTGQTRGLAWSLRSIGQLAAIAPDSDLGAGGVAADYRTLLANNYTTHKAALDANGSQVWSGSLFQSVYGNWGTAGSIAPWMTDFWLMTNGHLGDSEPLATMTNLLSVRDWMYRFVVGRLGAVGDTNQYPFTAAGQYSLEVSTDTGATWRQNWHAIYNATTGGTNNGAGNTLLGTSGADPAQMPTGYWGNLLPALSFAVEHLASGAAAAYARLVGATNYASSISGFNDTPVFGVLPRSGRVLQVGTGKAFTTISAAFSAARAGDTIELDPQDFTGTACTGTLSVPNVLVKGVGGRASMRAAGQHAQGKGTWVCSGNNITVENVNFYDAAVPDTNGSGIRIEGPNLTLRNCGFYDGQNGIQGGAGNGIIWLENCEFARNGFGDGFTHNVYVDVVDAVVAIGCYFHEAKIGHNFKSRARFNWLENNYFMDGPTGTASYLVDFSVGGTAFMRGNLLQKGPNADNSISVAYGQEGLATGGTHTLTMVHNTLVSTRSGGTFVAAPSGTASITWTANLFAGTGTGQITGGFSLGSVLQSENLVDSASNIPGADSIATPNFWPNSTLQALLNRAGTPDANYLNDSPTPYTLRAISASPRKAGALQASP